MFITEDKKGGQTLRLSRLEQGRLAAMNIQFIKVQKMREQGLPSKEIIEAELELASLRRSLEEFLK